MCFFLVPGGPRPVPRPFPGPVPPREGSPPAGEGDRKAEGQDHGGDGGLAGGEGEEVEKGERDIFSSFHYFFWLL